MIKIKPIETYYKGYHFRSRLEARFAVAFDHMTPKPAKWEYEFEGFDLGEAGWYLPDFWLPDLDVFAEVKPMRLNKEEVKKVKALYRQTGKSVLLLCGTPDLKTGYPAVSPADDGGFNINMWLRFGEAAIKAARSARFEHGEHP
jgi:hypothetical protein